MNLLSFARRKNSWRLTMPPDPIVEEIRLIRDQLAAKFNYDIAAIRAPRGARFQRARRR
jgi:hypothetical protein